MELRSIGTIAVEELKLPLKLYSSVRGKEYPLHQVTPDGNRVRQKLVDVNGEEVERKELLRAYFPTKDKPVIIPNEDLKALKEINRIAHILGRTESVPNVLVEKHYYCLPDKDQKLFSNTEIKFGLLKETCKAEKIVVEFAIRGKKHLGFFQTRGNYLVLTQMAYAQQLNQFEDNTSVKIQKELLEGFLEKISSLKKVDIKKVKDKENEQLEKLIKKGIRKPVKLGISTPKTNKKKTTKEAVLEDLEI